MNLLRNTTALLMLVLAATGARAAPNETTVDDPLAPARSGLAECTSPDEQAHTCHALTRYRYGPDGKWSYSAEILLSDSQPVSVSVDTDVAVHGVGVCGVNRRSDLMAGTLRYAGQALPLDKAAPILGRIADGMQKAGLLDVETCEMTVRTAEGLVLRGTIGGKPAPVPDRRLLWVRPEDGWKVAPAAHGKPESPPPAR